MNDSACLGKVGTMGLPIEISSKPGWLLESALGIFLFKTFLLKQRDENEIY